LANNTGDGTSAQTVGVVLSTSIGVNQKGVIITQGLLDGLSILPTATYNDGDPLFLGATPGSVTKTKPYAPNHLVYLGNVTTASNGAAGRWYVRVQNGYELDELHNVQARTPSLKDTLWYDNAVSPAQWKTASIPTILGYTPVSGSGTTNYVPKWDILGTGLVDSQVFDDGTYVRVGIGGGSMGFPYEKLILEAPQDMKFGAYTSVNNFALGGAAYVLGYTNVTTALGYYPGFEFQMSGSSIDDDNFIRYNFLQRNAAGTVIANNTNIFNLYADSRISFKKLIGTGTEMVVADASGFISRQPIPIDDTDYEYLMMSSFRNTYNY
jgi:hypothetical protein